MKNLLFSLLILGAMGCSKKAAPPAPKPVPVQMAKAIAKDVPYYISTVGHMEAYNIIDLMAQANGQLIETYFADGDDVKEGQLLYLIDQRPYLAELEKAEGQLEENIASLGYAERTAERNSQLVKDEYISQNDYDNLITNVIVDDALVKQSRADVENAKINLGYTTVYAPMDARAGESLIDDGNLILENAETTLVTLNQITPIYSTFFVNEKHLPAVQRYRAKYNDLKVYVTVDDPGTPTYEGLLTFIDNGVDLSTGMIKMKATLPNLDKILWPNQYVKVKLVLDTLENAVLVPFEAVQISPKTKYVYILKGNGTVERRNVTVGQMQEDNTIVITKGVKAGEKVITVGQVNLFPGAKVTVVTNEGDR
ncbi:efflux RND transporter periplasmic adaptor subunit [Candidatus Neptunochlamydia vexilliferae]|uniref:Multidrug resistance protein MdtA n=1 Tax=Candidatus Neptunichlamydia vexilliferae TaxID=1651774 RepID=A0ABS0B0W6_9BACT|nr:efflux RND transporter periplasmic adaptor subunit [Candidatus Neptunochlamydia vexilliferae]MBF5059482.1 Multidrug resistance protein MdtA [Candidatus Neptunochlamydia vexilliferae]